METTLCVSRESAGCSGVPLLTTPTSLDSQLDQSLRPPRLEGVSSALIKREGRRAQGRVQGVHPLKRISACQTNSPALECSAAICEDSGGQQRGNNCVALRDTRSVRAEPPLNSTLALRVDRDHAEHRKRLTGTFVADSDWVKLPNSRENRYPTRWLNGTSAGGAASNQIRASLISAVVRGVLT